MVTSEISKKPPGTTLSKEEQLIKEKEETHWTKVTNWLEHIEEILEKAYSDIIEIYELPTNTSRTALNEWFIATSNTPINKVEVLAVGGGLYLWLNGSVKGISMSAGSIIKDVDIFKLEYQVTSGTAQILLYGKSDRR